MVKRVLMIAYHFPPVKASSGIQRTLRFAQYLPEHDWHPVVLAPHPRVYDAVSDEEMGAALDGIEIRRTFALDTRLHLSIAGRYPRFAAVPDRWVSWCVGAVPAGLQLIRKFRPTVIWSTFPIATAHLIGLALHRLSGLPWVADFRDPMAQEGYPPDPVIWKSYEWIEKRAIRQAAAATFTTPGAARDYTRRYREQASRFSIIENGYDENAFVAAERAAKASPKSPGQPVTLLHSGAIYPAERDPRQFFAAIAELIKQGESGADSLRIVLRATQHDKYLQQLIDSSGIGSIVVLAPPIPYVAALQEMLTADGLLILQAANCNDQIPAKLYECLRARRPILGLTDPAGDTAQALRAAGVETIAALDSASAIAAALKRFVAVLRSGQAHVPDEAIVKSASRSSRTAELAGLLNKITQTDDA